MSQTQIPPLTFPYPEGKVKPRPAGQGCTSCIHKKYCGAFYWHIRNIEPVMPPEYGLSCPKWSNDTKDMVRTKGEGDFYQVEKWDIDGIGREPNQNGADDYTI